MQQHVAVWAGQIDVGLLRPEARSSRRRSPTADRTSSSPPLLPLSSLAGHLGARAVSCPLCKESLTYRGARSSHVAGPLSRCSTWGWPHTCPCRPCRRRLRAAVADGRLPGRAAPARARAGHHLGSRAGLHDLRDARCRGRRSRARHPGRDSERGGQATLHAPGQLVSYPIVPIPGRDLGAYVTGSGGGDHPGAGRARDPAANARQGRPGRLRGRRQDLVGRVSAASAGSAATAPRST